MRFVYQSYRTLKSLYFEEDSECSAGKLLLLKKVEMPENPQEYGISLRIISSRKAQQRVISIRSTQLSSPEIRTSTLLTPWPAARSRHHHNPSSYSSLQSWGLHLQSPTMVRRHCQHQEIPKRVRSQRSGRDRYRDFGDLWCKCFLDRLRSQPLPRQ
jgi:hypothetical protein